jgi:hypothetical protein
MKKLTALLLLAFGVAVHAQAAHQVNLAWTPSPDGGTVNVYRYLGSCTSGTWQLIKSGVPAAGPYVDTVAVGQFCYEVTAVVGGAESLGSNNVTASVLPQAPSALTAK